MIPVSNLLKHASEVETMEGNTYYKIPFWFQVIPDGTLIFYHRMPEDLSNHICKAGLGDPNYEIKHKEK